MKQQAPKTLPQKAETIENTRKTADILIGAACHQAAPKKMPLRKAQKFQLFRPIGTQCVMGVQSVRAKARRKLMHLSLRLVFTWNRIYKGNIFFVKGLKQLNNS